LWNDVDREGRIVDQDGLHEIDTGEIDNDRSMEGLMESDIRGWKVVKKLSELGLKWQNIDHALRKGMRIMIQ
jgi:hypothetical protein